MGSQVPFILKKRKDKNGVFYVSFKNELTGQIIATRSTETTIKSVAIKTAFEWYKNGIPQKKETCRLEELTIKDNIKKTNFSKAELDYLLNEYKNRGLIKSFTIAESRQDIPALNFMLDFWTWEKSEYIQEKLRQNHSIGKRHVYKMYGEVKNYWAGTVQDKVLNEISKKDIKDFIHKISDLSLSPKSKNDIIRSGTTPLRWAFNNELIEKDVTQGIIFFSGITKHRQILTKEMAQALFCVEWNDQRAKLANMLAMCTGLRAGEIQALQLKSLGENCLYVNHSWNFQDGLKCTKNGENRIVCVPFPQIIEALKKLAELNPYNEGLEGFVFWSTMPKKPMEQKNWLSELRSALQKIGLTEETAKEYCFHAWRHFFTAYMKNRVDDRVLQRQTGHKTLEMLEHYADHELSGEKKLLQQAQINTFGTLLEHSPEIAFNEKELYKTVQNENMDKTGMFEHSRQDR